MPKCFDHSRVKLVSAGTRPRSSSTVGRSSHTRKSTSESSRAAICCSSSTGGRNFDRSPHCFLTPSSLSRSAVRLCPSWSCSSREMRRRSSSCALTLRGQVARDLGVPAALAQGRHHATHVTALAIPADVPALINRPPLLVSHRPLLFGNPALPVLGREDDVNRLPLHLLLGVPEYPLGPLVPA